MGKDFPGPETGLWRFVLRLIALFSAVFGIIASTAGTAYPVNSFFYWLFLSLCGLWSLIVLGILCFKCAPHPGCCIAFDLIAAALSVVIVAVSAIDLYVDYYGRGIACLIFSLFVFVAHFTLFVVACIDVHRRRRLPNPKAPYREVLPEV
ncbi:hypothetical protein N7490_010840 [Penicillium lividum]|nr:hypothetical protein N7490_010840 [Penicillium lividum]